MVIGNGMVGARFVEEVRRRDPDGARVSLTVLGAESHPAYNRVLLSTVLAGGLRPGMVALSERGQPVPAPARPDEPVLIGLPEVSSR